MTLSTSYGFIAIFHAMFMPSSILIISTNIDIISLIFRRGKYIYVVIYSIIYILFIERFVLYMNIYIWYKLIYVTIFQY